MKAKILTGAFLLGAGLLAAQGPAPQVHTELSARLDTMTRTVEGQLRTVYYNRSGDTLDHIWWHLWANAFRNDRTAYSEALLDSGRTDFYFAPPEQRGYIGRLLFRSGESVLETEDHPEHQDLIRLRLPRPVAPGDSITIETPFRVKLPYYFSGTGYRRGRYMVRQWYPVPARYTDTGWVLRPYIPGLEAMHASGFHCADLLLPAGYAVESNGSVNRIAFTDSMQLLRLSAEETPGLEWTAIAPWADSLLTLPPPAAVRHPWISRYLQQPLVPAGGYNAYDGLQLGLLAHNYHREVQWAARANRTDTVPPLTPFRYYAAPLYAFQSKRLTGYGGVAYERRLPGRKINAWRAGLDLAGFSRQAGVDSMRHDIHADYLKFAPFLRFSLAPRSGSATRLSRTLEWRSFLIWESSFAYSFVQQDSAFYPYLQGAAFRYLNQLTFEEANDRVLYPYEWRVQLQQAVDFFRFQATARYFFHYPRGGGLRVRAFAGWFEYLGSLSPAEKSATGRFQPKLTAVRGHEDYTYSDPFLGREEFDGLGSYQIMERDGGLKLRTDLFQELQGRSDSWLASVHLSSSIPPLEKLPFPFPLRLFFDAGTWPDPWKEESDQPRFLYVAGLQLPLFGESVQVYAPVIFSKTFQDPFRTTPETKGFFRRISFSVDLSRLAFRPLGTKPPF